MEYTPITEENKQEWVEWLTSQQKVLDGREETSSDEIFKTPEGDIATAKDLVGNFLAYLTNQTQEIK